MKPVKVYTTPWCGFCVRAMRLLDTRHVPYEAIDVGDDDEARDWLVEVTGRRTVPQIFIGDQPIGGFTDLARLDASGELMELLHEEKPSA
jgi:glutaredoxin 3